MVDIVKESIPLREPDIITDIRFPMMTTSRAYLKGDNVNIYNDEDATFWSRFSNTGRVSQVSAEKAMAGTVDSVATIIIDVQGESGILTHVIGPKSNLATKGGAIYVYIDGELRTYSARFIDLNYRLLLGGFIATGDPITTVNTQQVGIGSYKDYGWNTNHVTTITPQQAIF